MGDDTCESRRQPRSLRFGIHLSLAVKAKEMPAVEKHLPGHHQALASITGFVYFLRRQAHRLQPESKPFGQTRSQQLYPLSKEVKNNRAGSVFG